MKTKEELIDWLDESEATEIRYGKNMTTDEQIRLETEIEVLRAVLK